MSFEWSDLFALTVSPLELVIRGSLVYLFLFIVFRTVLKRDIGAVGVADVLVLVLIADAAQNAMSADYHSVSDGLILISTILGWNLLFDVLAFRFPRLRRLLQPQELCLIRDGRIFHANLHREYLTVEDLLAKLREQGVTDPDEVHLAYMESDGAISVIRREPGKTGKSG
ncbi:MAG: DUF421 domain-containing protein [Bacteroidota bacterium]